MGIFLNIDRSKIKRLNEFEDENGNNTTEEVEDDYREEGEGNETNPEEDTGTTDTQTDTDAPEGETDDNTGEGEGTEGDENTEGEDDDIEDGGYTEDDDNADGEGNPEGEDNTGEDDDEYRIEDPDAGEDNPEGEEDPDTTDTDDTATSSDNSESKLKQLEGELFDQLSDDEKKIKLNELKKSFESMHSRCDGIIKMINNVTTPDENTSRIFEYLNDNLTDLKQYIYDYFTYTFETKSYLENSAQYQKYIAILNSLNNVLESAIKKEEKNKKDK